MDRRDFLQSIIASTGAVMLGNNLRCQSNDAGKYDLFPKGRPPDKLYVTKIPGKMNWHTKNLYSCFQGLINRQQTRIYLIHAETDKFWLQYYKDTFNIDYEELAKPDDLLKSFAGEISGYILYDERMPHSLNIATTIGALKNAVPASKDQLALISGFGLKKIEDLTGRWQNGYEAYEWALSELQPKCHQGLISQLCVHYPHWPTTTQMNRDYIIANNVFSVDLSTSERDKADYNLMRKIYEAYPPGAIVMGWHCVRDKEHEAIGLSSEFGHYGMCSLHTPNLSVHASIEFPEDMVFRQRQVNRRQLNVEDKVYIAYMATDGDATWFVKNLIETDWANPLHGKIKYNWGFLPMAYDLMPGMVKYYFDNILPNDYFVAGPAGATYTYPHLHPDKKAFLKLSQYYMRKCGLTTVHMTNWNDRDWWQEVDLPGYHNLLRETLPDCAGYVRGMGESAFEQHYIEGGRPYLFCGEGIHRGDDIYQVMKNFIDACPDRPLFIYNLVNHSIPMDQIHTAMSKFPKGEVELVHLDELLLLVEKAYEEGKITEELYPDKAGVQQILANEAKQAWPAFYDELQGWRTQHNSGESEYIKNITKTPIGLEKIVPGDMLAFAAIWHAMKLVKLALESKGIYVNHKPTAAKQFQQEFANLPDVKIVAELQVDWDNWHTTSITFEKAVEKSDQLIRLADELNENEYPIMNTE